MSLTYGNADGCCKIFNFGIENLWNWCRTLKNDANFRKRCKKWYKRLKKEAKNLKMTQMWVKKWRKSSKSEAKNDAKIQNWCKNTKMIKTIVLLYNLL